MKMNRIGLQRQLSGSGICQWIPTGNRRQKSDGYSREKWVIIRLKSKNENCENRT